MTADARLSFSRRSSTGAISGFHQKNLRHLLDSHDWSNSEKSVGLEIELAI
jgi:hypothetical protein